MPLCMGRLRQLARAANHDPPRFNGEVDDGAINSRQIDANANACLAAVSVDGRLPRVCKSGKLRTRQFVADIVQCTMKPAQLNVSDWVHCWFGRQKISMRTLRFQWYAINSAFARVSFEGGASQLCDFHCAI